MPRRWPVLTRLFLTLGLFAWVSGSFASSVHTLLVQHVVCPDHGEIVELDPHEHTATNAPESSDRTAISSSGPHGHPDHGCSDDLADRIGVPGIAWVAPYVHTSRRVVDVQRGVDAPRGPPLAYAPKTSPPTLG